MRVKSVDSMPMGVVPKIISKLRVDAIDLKEQY